MGADRRDQRIKELETENARLTSFDIFNHGAAGVGAFMMTGRRSMRSPGASG